MSIQDEFARIRQWTEGKQSLAFQQASGVELGIGDDAAVAGVTPGYQLVMTCDTMVEEIHFSAVTMTDEDVGYKAMSAAISDIAAMGAVPRYALVAISMARTVAAERVEAMYRGLYQSANRWGVVVVGGDTTSTESGVTVTVTVIGEVEAGKALKRSSAQVGDVVVATGELGLAAAGLEFLVRQGLPASAWSGKLAELGGEWSQYASLIQAHCRPEAQVEAGLLLQRSGVCHALNDVSDGLASEAWEIVEASGLGIDLLEERLPYSLELMQLAGVTDKEPIDYVLFGGEDYQLVATLPAEHAIGLQVTFREAGIPLHIIGYVNPASNEVRLVQGSGIVLAVPKRGYNHFGEGGSE